ncbi:dihydrodipicolinate synthase family protein [Fusobacterium sp. PH5-44]|uniref:dihydrodipicolinate synthase family protein n=1 Tax=unclassified Fusobacterium TaxID=2648384 RepID=UPI003D196045
MAKKMYGIYSATLTPFNNDDTINSEAMLKIMDRNLHEGASGFFIGGSSAECFLLSPTERVMTFEIASALKNKTELIAHIGSLSTKEAIYYGKEAKRFGFEHIAATPPLYYGFSSREVSQYYKDIYDAVKLPLIVYNFPGNTKREFDLNDPNYAELFKSDVIEGIKHTNQVVYQMERFIALNPKLKIWNGFDETMVAGLALGAQGSIGSTFNCMLPHYKKIYDAFLDGKIDFARELQHKANNIMEALCKVGLIAAIKYVVTSQGINTGNPRKPFTPLDEVQKKYVDEVLEKNLVSL